jgi:tRNA pseudouridine38-40 synthase
MIFFLHLGYDGSDYSGWQWQPNAPSIQGEIEDNLEAIFKQKITVFGCGRTDAGVHASQYVMHIELASKPSFDLKFRLNKNLPDDIVVYDVIEMEDNRHSRYDATLRTYDYFIHSYKDPVLYKHSSYYDLEAMDINAMQKAASLLTKYQDYKSVCKQPHLYKHTLCEVSEAKLYVSSDNLRLRFTITANRFLRGMIRLLIYFLLKVGKGEMTLEAFENMLSKQIEYENKMPAFPNGLYLSRIQYPYISFDHPTDISKMLKEGLQDN